MVAGGSGGALAGLDGAKPGASGISVHFLLPASAAGCIGGARLLLPPRPGGGGGGEMPNSEGALLVVEDGGGGGRVIPGLSGGLLVAVIGSDGGGVRLGLELEASSFGSEGDSGGAVKSNFMLN